MVLATRHVHGTVLTQSTQCLWVLSPAVCHRHPLSLKQLWGSDSLLYDYSAVAVEGDRAVMWIL